MVKDMSESSPRRSNDSTKENLFHVGVLRDVLFAEKVVLRYRCKTRHTLGKNCPVVSPTLEDSDMSFLG